MKLATNICPLFIKKFGDNRPYIRIKLFGQELLALVDTGSNSTILGSLGFSFLQHNNVPILYDNCMKVTTADGKLQDCLGYICVPLTISNVVKEVKILVIPSVKHTLILGMDFLKLFNIEVNFSSFNYMVSNETSVVNTIKSLICLSDSQKNQLEIVIEKFKDIAPEDSIGRTHLIEHEIDTGTSKPICQKQYPLSPTMRNHLNKQIDEMLELGVIEPSKSAWCSPLWLVPKSSGEFRVCFDGRKLNQVTLPDAYPMHNIDAILNKLRDACYLSSIDLRHAFFQVPLEKSSREKTAFGVYGRGLYQFCVMPFGLLNSPKTMARLIDMVIGPSLEPYCYAYLDDLIIATPTFELHLEVLNRVYERLRDAKLTINLKKSEFCLSSLNYLGYVINDKGLHTDPGKVEAIVNYKIPTTTTEIKRLIGLVGWYRRFIKDFSTVAAPITDLLHGRKKGQSIIWTSEADDAFKEIKLRLTNAPVLASPDFSKPFTIQCDASDFGLGAVLYQDCDGLDHPIAYASRSLTSSERKYTVTEKELLAILFAMEKFRSYVEGTHVTIESDHSSLQWITTLSNPSGRLARWAMRLSQYNFTIKHRKGALNVVADSLSRSVVDIAVVDISTFKPDNWYRNMIHKVMTSPEKFPTFRVENNILYKHVFSNNPIESNLTNWKIVVPTFNRPEVLKLYHDDETAAHLGMTKTLYRILELYYWPRMKKDICLYVKKCTVCAASKSSNLPRAGHMGTYKNINFPFQWISADLIGPYPRSKNGNAYALVVVDWFTKFCLIHPMPKANSKNIVKFIENEVFLIYGVPQIFSCDNGSQFISKEFKNLMQEYKVQEIFYNANYHPQINHTERTNKVIVTAVRSYVHENHKIWDASIHKVAQAIRLAKHDVTGYSPSFLNFARNVPLTGDFYGKISENSDNVVSVGEKLQLVNDIQTLPTLYVDVREKLKKAHSKYEKLYNLRKRDVEYHVGDKLWKKNYIQSNKGENFAAKLAPKFIPCVVHKVISKLVYNLRDLEGKDLGNWHVKDIKGTFYDNEENLPEDDIVDI